jgi:hypothetical protein
MERDLSTLGACDFLSRLLRDHGGNTLALLAAGLIPLLALVGGGIDMGRSYLSQTRLQQACDAGVLAARKKLGSAVVTDGVVPTDVATIGNRFFNINFQNGSYATDNRNFTLTLEEDYAISGEASVDVPTTVMGMFGYDQMPIEVQCEAKLNFSNTDVMFVLDTTGSMNETNPSDTVPRINILRDVVKDFHAQMEGSKSPSTRLRYGFLPYSTNVRVADILRSDWMVDRWTYQSRTVLPPTVTTVSYYYVNRVVQSGTNLPITPYVSATCPADTYSMTTGPSTEVSTDPHEYWYQTVENGIEYSCTGDDGNWNVTGIEYVNFTLKQTWTFAYNGDYYSYIYRYHPVEFDVTPLKSPSGDDAPLYGSIQAHLEGRTDSADPNMWNVWNTGCIEERDTYEIDDWDNVDLTRALDLDIDLVPTPGNPSTQWRPMLPELVFERSIESNGTGSFTTAPVDDDGYFLNPAWASRSACPAAARKLGEMSAADVATYVDGLVPTGDTYHDIGMIWGARMLSPTGIFADENADIDGKPTARHMIFLTDGETETFDINYGAYGVDGLDQRRWRSAAESGIGLDDVVEKRSGVACAEARKRNITVWVIGFGVGLNPIMTECAGPGHHFEATDAAELAAVFSNIASQMGDLRISK